MIIQHNCDDINNKFNYIVRVGAICPYPLRGIMNTVLSPPIPPYQNLPIREDYYEPSRFVITAISLGKSTLVTTEINNNYVIGQQIRLLIPSSFGTYQLNGATGYVISIPTLNQVEIDIDSSQMDAFKSSSNPTLPQIIAIGDINQGVISNVGPNVPSTAIPGSFINISPQ